MTTTAVVLLSLHLAATAAMTGLIWFVQVVHYPLFAAVGADQFVAYEVAHQRRTSACAFAIASACSPSVTR